MKLGIYLAPNGELVELKKAYTFDYQIYSSEDYIVMKFDKGSKNVMVDYFFIGVV